MPRAARHFFWFRSRRRETAGIKMTRVCLESRLGDHFRQQGRLTEVMARYRQEAIQIDRHLEKPQFNAEAQRLAEVRRELFSSAFLRVSLPRYG